MSRIHDMGGRLGYGPIVSEEHGGSFFVENWHARALAITLAAGFLGRWNIDASRHSRERLTPNDYTRFSYYERWLAALANLLLERGLVTREELENPNNVLSSASEGAAIPAGRIAEILKTGSPSRRESDANRSFAVGDKVWTVDHVSNRFVDGGHTRLPEYARGRKGGHCSSSRIACISRQQRAFSRRGAGASIFGRVPLVRALGNRNRAPARLDSSRPMGKLFEKGLAMHWPKQNGFRFSEPWQAQLYAVTVELSVSGFFWWDDWAQFLSTKIAGDMGTDDPEYFRLWLEALVMLLEERGVLEFAEIERVSNLWKDAYIATPHGKQVTISVE